MLYFNIENLSGLVHLNCSQLFVVKYVVATFYRRELYHPIDIVLANVIQQRIHRIQDPNF